MQLNCPPLEWRAEDSRARSWGEDTWRGLYLLLVLLLLLLLDNVPWWRWRG
jgi:hypothetical protein